MAEKLTVDLKKKAAEPAAVPVAPTPSLEEIPKPDAPVVQRVAIIDRSHVAATPTRKPRTLSDIRI